MRARARARDWDAIKQATFKKGFFSSKHESPIGFLPICEALHENGAPAADLSMYVQLIADDEERIVFCTRIGALYEVAIDACVAMRDRERLLRLDGAIVARHGANAHAHLLLQHRLTEETRKGTAWK